MQAVSLLTIQCFDWNNFHSDTAADEKSETELKCVTDIKWIILFCVFARLFYDRPYLKTKSSCTERGFPTTLNVATYMWQTSLNQSQHSWEPDVLFVWSTEVNHFICIVKPTCLTIRILFAEWQNSNYNQTIDWWCQILLVRWSNWIHFVCER